MKWSEIRSQYTDRWLLVEASSARSERDRRIVDDLVVVSEFDESRAALRTYLDLHSKEPQRELYVAHTSREVLEIEERRWAGIRAPAQASR